MKRILYNDYKVKKNSLFFILGMILWIVRGFIANSYYVYLIGYQIAVGMEVLAIICFLIQILYVDKNYSLKTFIFTIIFFFSVAMATYSSGTLGSSTNLLILLLIFVAGRNIDFEEICRCAFWVTLLCIIFLVLSSYLGIIKNLENAYGGRIRYALGATYVGLIPCRYLDVFFCGLFLFARDKNKMKKSWFKIMLLLLGAYYIYVKTDTRLSFYLTILSFIMYYILVIFEIDFFGFKKKGRLKRWMFCLSYPLSCILVFWASKSFSWNNAFWYEINQILSGRLQYNAQGIAQYGIHLFGSKIEYYNFVQNTGNLSDYFYIDSGYIGVTLQYGVVFLVILLVLYMLMFNEALKRGNVFLCVWIFVEAFYNIINNMMFAPIGNTLIFLFWEFVLNQKIYFNSAKGVKYKIFRKGGV